jgi:hypothetical protein
MPDHTTISPEGYQAALEMGEQGLPNIIPILECNPELGWNGFLIDPRYPRHLMRAHFYTTDALELFVNCCIWLGSFRQTKQINPNFTTAGLRKVISKDFDKNVPQGVLLAAALHNNHILQRVPGTGTARLNIHDSAIRGFAKKLALDAKYARRYGTAEEQADRA